MLMVAVASAAAAQNDRLKGLITRHDAAVIVGIRFAYGIRIAGPLLVGAGLAVWWIGSRRR